MPYYVYIIYFCAVVLWIVASVMLMKTRKRLIRDSNKSIEDYMAMRVELENGYYNLYNDLYSDHQIMLNQLKKKRAPEELMSFFKRASDNIYSNLAKVATHIETSSVSDPLYAQKLQELSKK